MIRPNPAATMWGTAALQAWYTPSTFTCWTRRQSSSRISWNGARMLIPALLTRMSTRPSSSMQVRTADSTDARSATSAGADRTFRPVAEAISSAAARSSPAVRAISTTSAPASAKVRAISLPRPLLPPVTIAARPVNSNRSFIVFPSK